MEERGSILSVPVPKTSFRAAAQFAFLMMACFACGDGGITDEGDEDDSRPSAQAVSVTVSAMDERLFYIEDQTVVSASVTLNNGATVNEANVAWSSSDEGIATVDTEGYVTAVGPGTVRVDADYLGLTGSVDILVEQYVDSLAFLTDSLILAPGEGSTLLVAGWDVLGYPVEEFDVTWESSRPLVLSVSDSGVVEAGGGMLGPVTITARADGGMAESNHSVRTSFSQVSAGRYFTCGLAVSGLTYCWGEGSSGRLGYPGRVDAEAPAAVAGDPRFVDLQAGYTGACGLTGTGDVLCWGSRGFAGSFDAPTAVAVGTSLESITVGRDYQCGLTSAGVAYCWGSNGGGQLGDGSVEDRALPAPVAGGITFETLRGSCGLAVDGTGYCWGYTIPSTRSPVDVAPGVRWTYLTAPDVCAIADDGGTYCWRPFEEPEPIAGAPSFDAVFSSGYHACGLTPDGSAYCWGSNGRGQLGDGTRVDAATPVPVAGEVRFSHLTLSVEHTCGLTADGSVYCWGDNVWQQSGLGYGVFRGLEPTRILGSR